MASECNLFDLLLSCVSYYSFLSFIRDAECARWSHPWRDTCSSLQVFFIKICHFIAFRGGYAYLKSSIVRYWWQIKIYNRIRIEWFCLLLKPFETSRIPSFFQFYCLLLAFISSANWETSLTLLKMNLLAPTSNLKLWIFSTITY